MKEVIIAIIGSGALSALVSGIVNLLNAKQKARKGSDKMILFICAAQLNMMAQTFIGKESINLESLKLFNDLYDLYKDKGGNGYIDTIRSKVNNLKIDQE